MITVEKDLTVSNEIRKKIADVAARASEADKKALATLIAEAKQGAYRIVVKSITPPMAASIFLEHNPHNRDWSPLWSEELARRQIEGQWRKNNATIGFYSDGILADGQNRCAAAALSGHTLETGVTFGLERDAITTIDGARGRHASDKAKLDGIKDAKRKEALVKTVSSYLVRSGDMTAKLRSETEIAQAIETNNVVLEDAIEIGSASRENIVTPQLKDQQAQALAYLMLQSKWPARCIREELTLFQSGVSRDGEHATYFVAGDMLAKAREARSKKDQLTAVKELGVVVYAMVQTQKGVTSLQRYKFKDAVKKVLPSPLYPGSEQQAAE